MEWSSPLLPVADDKNAGCTLTEGDTTEDGDLRLDPVFGGMKGVEGEGGVVGSTWFLGLTVSLSYALSFFWRYTIYVLPSNISDKPVAHVNGRAISFQLAVSMAYTLGFFLAKFFAVRAMTGRFFYRHRTRCLASILTGSMLIECVPLLVLPSYPWAQLACVFISCFFQSWLYGGMFTFLEGRQRTEVLIASISFLLVFASSAARGVGQLLLQVPAIARAPHSMPLAAGLVGLPPSLLLLWLAGKAPPPSQADEQARSKRGNSDGGAQLLFSLRFWPGIFLTALPYASLTAVRAFRDFFAEELFSASLASSSSSSSSASAATPTSLFLFLVDVPGGLVAIGCMLWVSRFRSNQRATEALLLLSLLASLLLLLATACFQANWIGGAAWQVLTGIGVYVGYLLIGGPVLDRIIACVGFRGTCSFLLYSFDGLGYTASLSLLSFKAFFSLQDSSPAPTPAPSALSLSIPLLSGHTSQAVTRHAIHNRDRDIDLQQSLASDGDGLGFGTDAQQRQVLHLFTYVALSCAALQVACLAIAALYFRWRLQPRRLMRY